MTDLITSNGAHDIKAHATFGRFLLAVKAALLGDERAHDWLKYYGSIKAPLAEGSGATGGYTVPPGFSTAIYNIAAPISIVRPRATIVPMSSRTISLPYLDQQASPASGTSALIGNIAAAWLAEAASLPSAEPTFRAAELVANKLAAAWTSAHELDEDSAEGMGTLAQQLFGRAVAWFEDNGFIGGTGVNQPLGVINAPATIGVSRNTPSHFKVQDVYAMLSKAHPNSINGRTLVWVMHPTVLVDVGALTNLQPTSALDLGGFPIKVSEQCSVLGTAGDVLLCDFSHYLIGERRTLTVAVSPHPKFTNDQDVFRLTERIDGQPWLSDKITLKDGSNTVSPFLKLV